MAKESFFIVRYVYCGIPNYALMSPRDNMGEFIDSLPKDKVSFWSISELIEQSPIKTSEDGRLPSTNIVITFDSGSYEIKNGYTPDKIQDALKDLNFKDVSEIKIRIV